MRELSTDVLIVGGGTGGVAAAISATSLGCRVLISDPTDWLGGQLTSQAVPPDENPWIEQTGGTDRYHSFRSGVRKYYRDHLPLTNAARNDPRLNPGGGFVSQLCHEPRIGVSVIDQMLAPARQRGLLRTLLRHEPIAADTDGDRVKSVTLRCLETGDELTVHAKFVLDATELGDLLPMTGTEYVSGAESKKETGEMHAKDQAQPNNVQALTWCFAIGLDTRPGAEHVIDKPKNYEKWRDYEFPIEPAWPNRVFDWHTPRPFNVSQVFDEPLLTPEWPGGSKWCKFRYRQVVNHQSYEPGYQPDDATVVNWPQIDYIAGNVIDASEEDRARYLAEAREQSLAFLYWIQTDAPRSDGKGQGYPEIYPCPEMLGTPDGFAKHIYVRESRRIKAVFTVTEAHVGTEMRTGHNPIYNQVIPELHGLTAEHFEDSVGIGSYRIDLHPSTGGDNYIDVSSLPFQIPLGALLPQRMKNLLPACKNLGVTHITNGCYRLHPVEWNIGESVGVLAAACIQRGWQPHQVREDKALLAEYQALLQSQGVELAWPKTRGL